MSKLITALKQYIVLASVYFSLVFFLPVNKTAQHNFHLTSVGYHVLLFIIIGVTYCYITFRFLNLQSVGSDNNPYYLPAWLMILTVIIPFLYTWLIGLLAAYEIYLYSKNVEGILYQRAMRLLSGGVTSVIASSIVVQYLRSAVPRTEHLSFNSVLLIVNIAYIFYGARIRTNRSWRTPTTQYRGSLSR